MKRKREAAGKSLVIFFSLRQEPDFLILLRLVAEPRLPTDLLAIGVGITVVVVGI